MSRCWRIPWPRHCLAFLAVKQWHGHGALLVVRCHRHTVVVRVQQGSLQVTVLGNVHYVSLGCNGSPWQRILALGTRWWHSRRCTYSSTTPPITGNSSTCPQTNGHSPVFGGGSNPSQRLESGSTGDPHRWSLRVTRYVAIITIDTPGASTTSLRYTTASGVTDRVTLARLMVAWGYRFLQREDGRQSKPAVFWWRMVQWERDGACSVYAGFRR